jgi:hypothetical protein
MDHTQLRALIAKGLLWSPGGTMGEDSPEDPTPATPLIRIESSSPVSTGISELDRELGGGA